METLFEEMKGDAIDLWEWLAWTGCRKEEYPLYDEMSKKYKGCCPLCEVYYPKRCDECPLRKASKKDLVCTELYTEWYEAMRLRMVPESKEAASKILDAIRKWEED